MPAHSKRKVLRISNAKVVTLPADWVRAFQLKGGEEVDMFYDSIVIVKPQQLQFDHDFMIREFEILTKLSQKANQSDEEGNQ